MNQEEKPDLSKWTIKQLVNSLTAPQLWAVLWAWIGPHSGGNKMRSSRLRLLGVLALAATAVFVVTAQQPTRKVDAPAVRQITANDFKELLRNRAVAGRPLLINFWATWCHGCRQEMPDLVKTGKQFEARGLEFITVSMDKPSEIDKGVPEFLNQVGASLAHAYLANPDEADTIMHAAEITWDGEMPATFLYDNRGTLTYSHHGVITPAELQSAIEKVLRHNQ